MGYIVDSGGRSPTTTTWISNRFAKGKLCLSHANICDHFCHGSSRGKIQRPRKNLSLSWGTWPNNYSFNKETLIRGKIYPRAIGLVINQSIRISFRKNLSAGQLTDDESINKWKTYPTRNLSTLHRTDSRGSLNCSNVEVSCSATSGAISARVSGDNHLISEFRKTYPSGSWRIIN